MTTNFASHVVGSVASTVRCVLTNVFLFRCTDFSIAMSRTWAAPPPPPPPCILVPPPRCMPLSCLHCFHFNFSILTNQCCRGFVVGVVLFFSFRFLSPRANYKYLNVSQHLNVASGRGGGLAVFRCISHFFCCTRCDQDCTVEDNMFDWSTDAPPL